MIRNSSQIGLIQGSVYRCVYEVLRMRGKIHTSMYRTGRGIGSAHTCVVYTHHSGGGESIAPDEFIQQISRFLRNRPA